MRSHLQKSFISSGFKVSQQVAHDSGASSEICTSGFDAG
tara:strand:+ start:442 stop:558 length:117 start_codon:yes stop_codon:yes gene_type:complete